MNGATRSRHHRRATRSAWPWTLAAALIVGLLLTPFVPLVLASLADGYFHPQVVPERVSLRAWRLVLGTGSAGWHALATSVVVALLVTGIAMLVAVPAGRVLGTRPFRGRRAVELALLTPVLVPPIAIALGLHVVFVRLGLDGAVVGVVLVHLVPTIPYVALLSAGVFENLDTELELQARSLGANRRQLTVHVTLPAVAPGLAVAGLFAFLVSWGQYASTLVIGGGRVVTLPILLFAAASGGDVSFTAATALFHGVPAVVLLVVASRIVTDGRFIRSGGPR